VTFRLAEPNHSERSIDMAARRKKSTKKKATKKKARRK